MRTNNYKFLKCCLSVLAAVLFTAAFLPPATAQQPDVIRTLPFAGAITSHEGMAGWDATGTGPEPYGSGHQIPLPDFTNMPYYGASLDFGGIDPFPRAALAHALDNMTGFPHLASVIHTLGLETSDLQIRLGLCSLGEDQLGYDWFIVGEDDDQPHAFYYDVPVLLLLEGQPMIGFQVRFLDVFTEDGDEWYFSSSFALPDSVWEYNADPFVKKAGRAFLLDVGTQELRLMATLEYAADFNGNGRTGGRLSNVEGILETGYPELPYIGMVDQDQGLAAWNADGTGPEPAADGHLAQEYYTASLDYDDIFSSQEAALGHFLPEMKGFLNLQLQIEFRGYTPEEMLIKQGLASLGNDVFGKDWGTSNSKPWCNYYDLDYSIVIGGEVCINGLTDTSRNVLNLIPAFWNTGSTSDIPKDASGLSSNNIRIITGAFLKDLEDRRLFNIIQTMTVDPVTFNGHGRYDCELLNVEDAKVLARHCNIGHYVLTDTLSNNSGNITYWLKESSPIYINNSIVIEEGHTLVIDTGAVIVFRGPYTLDVRGGIVADGSKDEGILLTHSNPINEWNSILFREQNVNIASRFKYCTFEYSHSIKASPYNSGGAMMLRDYDNLLLSHCTFRYNTADQPGQVIPGGGAIALWSSDPTIEYCTFYQNQAVNGGAVKCYLNSSPVIRYSLFSGNSASEDGGAIAILEGSSPSLLNNTIADNLSDSWGGGVSLEGCTSDSVLFINNILWGNYCGMGQRGQEVGLKGSGNIASFRYNDIYGGLEGIGPGNHYQVHYSPTNMMLDPLFCSPEELVYTIGFGSPCVGKGQGGLNIGAFEADCFAIAPEISGPVQAFTIRPNPCPAEHPVVVTFHQEVPGVVKLEIYNLAGAKISEPLSGSFAAGDHQEDISFNELSAGIYFGRLTITGEEHLKKIVIIK